ncbi:MAG: hypothetical protein IKN87_05495 [Bacilli bacterium]|nr:hypothetical protein [Bacilli bacterium]
MELRHPLVLLLIPLIIIIYLFINRKRKNNYIGGSKIANTNYIKESTYYKKKLRSYKIFLFLVKTMCFISIIISVILLSRPARIETRKINEYNRDIFICMDVSLSVNELNEELVDELKKLVKKLDGERIGISIFNTSSVTLVPLTDDYDYLNDTLDQLKTSFHALGSNGSKYYDENYLYNYSYLMSGTLEDNQTKGSSLIGDGLASCVFSFSNLDEKNRTRAIIFTTDNDLAGTPSLTLDEAATISKKKKIVVYGISPKVVTKKNEFKDAMLKTNGKYYNITDLKINNIVSDINKTSKTLLDTKKETKEYDIPAFPFIFLLSSIILLFIASRKVVK